MVLLQMAQLCMKLAVLWANKQISFAVWMLSWCFGHLSTSWVVSYTSHSLSPVSTATVTFPQFSSLPPPLCLPYLSCCKHGRQTPHCQLVCCNPYQNTHSAKDTSLGGSLSFVVALSTCQVTSPHAHSQDFLFIHFLYLGEQLDSSSCFPPQTVSEMRW